MKNKPYNNTNAHKGQIMMVISYPDMRLKKEMESLQNNGFNVKVIMWERGWPFPNENNIPIKSLKINAPAGNFKSFLFFPIWWLYLTISLLKSDWDVIHAVNFDTYLFSLLTAKIKNKPIVYDIFDFYGDVMPSFLRNFVITLDKSLLPYSNALILADDSRVEQIGGRIHNNIFTINNSPQETLFDLKNQDNSTEIKNYFKVFIGGKIAQQRCLDLIISVISKLKDTKLIIRGHCGEKEYKEHIIKIAKNCENIDLCLDGVPYDEIIEGTMSSDLTIALYDPDIPNNKYASPNKLFEAMASKIPIIVNEKTSMADIVKNEDCGMVIPFRDENALKNTISLLKDNPSLKNRLGNNGRTAYENKYSWSIMERRLVTIYDQVLS